MYEYIRTDRINITFNNILTSVIHNTLSLIIGRNIYGGNANAQEGLNLEVIPCTKRIPFSLFQIMSSKCIDNSE